ncbi:hemicentin-1-like [Haliotis rufescens]|uniref:hemicentin-1-like n=1 Tax=Haliotis rufescens TaxID=6454 RepID=UPI00201F7B46|nr:hemicentin-1-like [Haliotis rufescens]
MARDQSISYLFLLFLSQNVHCTNISISGPLQYARIDQSLQMTCTVPESEAQLGTFTFKRNYTYGICSRTVTTCTPLLDTVGYNCSCGAQGVLNLTILKVRLRDIGIWSCERASSSSLYLNVYYGPFNNVTVDKTSPMTVIEDVTVSLTARCSADCNPGCSYIWMSGTQQVSHKRDLPVGTFRRGHGGDYTCTARNTATGDTAHSQTLTVNVQWRPTLPTHNCPSWIVTGQTVTCRCQTTDRGNPEGTIKWISPGGQTLAFSRSSSVSLHLASVPKSDNGTTFICKAANPLSISGGDSIYSVNIAYLERPQLNFDKVEAQGTASVTVTCTVESNPIAEMTMENIGSEAQPAFGVTNNLTFTTKAHCLHDKFRCTAENSQTKTQISAKEQLNVACSPRHDSSKQKDSIVNGKPQTTASLIADVIANPLPNFTWYHYQGMTPVPVVVGTDNVVLTKGLQSVLKVHIKRDEDYGIYRVVVQNRVGITSLFFSLTKDVSTPEILPVAAGEGAVIVMLIVAIVIILIRRSLFKEQ